MDCDLDEHRVVFLGELYLPDRLPGSAPKESPGMAAVRRRRSRLAGAGTLQIQSRSESDQCQRCEQDCGPLHVCTSLESRYEALASPSSALVTRPNATADGCILARRASNGMGLKAYHGMGNCAHAQLASCVLRCLAECKDLTK